tara:strand:- start:14101 stop:14268 length:168 start_codon:yes stop_codon:yes gene_type:complete
MISESDHRKTVEELEILISRYEELVEALVGDNGLGRYTHEELLDFIQDLLKEYQK